MVSAFLFESIRSMFVLGIVIIYGCFGIPALKLVALIISQIRLDCQVSGMLDLLLFRE